MRADLTAAEIERYADGELSADENSSAEEHLRDCARCATAVLDAVRMKRAVSALPRAAAPQRLRADVLRSIRRESPRQMSPWWLAAAAAIVVLIAGATVAVDRSRSAGRELLDLHTTLVASSNPVEVISSDRHTVKPWFEGRVPFAVQVPELTSTPFRLIGGRVVFWRGRPGAYLLVTKGAHRISVFVFESRTAPRPARMPQMSLLTWTRNGLTYTAVADLSPDDLKQLRDAFLHA
jgi:anti-sigma factor RsiW